MNLRSASRGIIIAALLSALLYAVLAALTDSQAVAATLRDFPPTTMVWMILLTLAGYLLRAVRWGYLMRRLDHPMTARDAVFTQLAGMTMSVTPARVGEVVKAYLARELAGLPMPRGIAAVLCERLADLIGVLALSAGAISLMGDTLPALITVAILVATGTWLLGSSWFHRVVLRVASRQPWMRDHNDSVTAVWDAVRALLAYRPLAVSIGLSFLAWGLEGVAFGLCIRAIGFDGFTLGLAAAVYAIASVLGALTFLPGGIGLTEVSMTGLLVAAGMSGSDASVATLIIRIVTMWLGVALGWLALLSRPGLVAKLAGFNHADQTAS